jgi:glutathione peroxidase
MESFYKFSAKALNGKPVNMDKYKGKVVLVVNTASKCGFTPQYAGLQELYQKYNKEGLEILGFPCNQFGNQEPGGSKEIAEGCLVNYGVSFQMFEKTDVNGEHAHPIFNYLKNALPGIGKDIKWNFTKFVINKDGKPVKRYAPITKSEKLEPFIKKLLNLN